MREMDILFETSPWFILLCLIVGALYAFILYQRKSPWGKTLNRTLASLRFALTAILCFLLLGPFIKQISARIEDPTVVLAIDNSLSVRQGMDSAAIHQALDQLDELTSKLKRQNYNTDIFTFDGSRIKTVQDISFDHPSTDLNKLLSDIQNAYEGKKIAGVALLTDGIYNIGISPSYRRYNFNVFPVGVGDTAAKSDINLRALYYNQIAYQGNKFPIVSEILNTGFVNEAVTVGLYHKGDLIDSRTIQLEEDNQTQRVEFQVDAEEEGMQHYVVSVSEKEGEFTLDNNTRHAYIDVIEGKERILCVAPAPHPDIKALRAAIENNQNYEFTLFIPGLTKNEDEVLNASDQTFDLVIFHHSPDKENRTLEAVNLFSGLNTPAWYFVGPQTDLTRLQRQTDIFRISQVEDQKDRVTPVFNDNFNRFNLNDDIQTVLNTYPPVTVPFGRWNVAGSAEALLYQRVGSVATTKPLLVLNEGARKEGVFLGDGIWRWRQQEYAKTESHEIFDELIEKMVQLLSAKEDRRKFKVYPVRNEFFDTEPVVFETEVYNDIYERIYGQRIELTIKDEENQSNLYTYTTSPNSAQYRIGDLRQGVYTYRAATTLNGELVESEGEFTVKQLQLESMNLTANFDLLRSVARQTNGEFYTVDEIAQLEEELSGRQAQGVVFSSEEFLPIINMDWIFFLLLILVSVEWFTRKYNSSY